MRLGLVSPCMLNTRRTTSPLEAPCSRSKAYPADQPTEEQSRCFRAKAQRYVANLALQVNLICRRISLLPLFLLLRTRRTSQVTTQRKSLHLARSRSLVVHTCLLLSRHIKPWGAQLQMNCQHPLFPLLQQPFLTRRKARKLPSLAMLSLKR